MQNKYATRSGGLPPGTAATRSRWVFSVWLLLCLLASSAAVFGQTVSSDKDDYKPGEVATIAGAGWQPGETVFVEFKEEPDYPDYHKYYPEADSAGNWVIKYDIEERHLWVKFIVTAIGQESGYRATTVFTDGGEERYTPTLSPTQACVGSSVNFKINVTNNSTLQSTSPVLKSFQVIIPNELYAANTGFALANITTPNGWTKQISRTGNNANNHAWVILVFSSQGIPRGENRDFYVQLNTPSTVIQPITLRTEAALIENLNLANNNNKFVLAQGAANPTLSFTNILPAAPTVLATGQGNQTVCSNVSQTLTAAASPASGSTLVWYTGPTGNNTTANPTQVGVGTVTYYAASRSAAGCESAARTAVTLTINPAPTATLTSSNADNAICAGASVTFTAGAVANASYEFFVTTPQGPTLSQGTTASPTFTTNALTNGQTVTVKVTANGCSTTSAGIATSVTPRPTLANAGNDQSINGISTNLAGNTAAVGTGAWSIVGNAPGGTLADASDPQSGFSGLPGTTYTLRWTISNGICAASTDDVSITFNQVSTATTLANATATYGDASVNLVATVSPAAATGTVAFLVNNVAVGTATLSSGTATFAYNLDGVNANTYTIQAKYAGSGPYTPSSGNGTLIVSPRALTIGITAANKGYDGNATATVSAGITGGLVSGDQVTVAATDGQFSDKNAGPDKTVTADVSITGGAKAANYTANTSASTTATISPRPLDVTATAAGKEYDGLVNAQATLSDDRLPGDVLTITFDQAGFDSKNVGTNKTVTISGIAVAGKDGANYALTNATVTDKAAITPRALAVTADAASKVYDGNATAQVTLSDNRLGNDVLTVEFAAAAFNNKNAGTGKPVTVSGISLGGADAGNYQFNTTANATANITPKPVTATLLAQDKVYDGNDLANAGASIPVVGTDSVAMTVTGVRFNNKNVGTNKPVTATVAFSSPDGANYSLTATTASTTASITAKALAVNVTAQNKVYDGNAEATVTASVADGLVAGDDVTVTAANGAFEDKNVGENKEVTASVSKSGDDAGNYAVNASAQTTADITARELTAFFTANDKMYDGTAAAVIASRGVNGKVGSDDVNLVGGTAVFADRNAGDDKTVNGTGFVLGGTAAGNYRLASGSATTQASIAVRPVAVTANADSRAYNGTNVSEVAPTTPVLQPGDAVATAPVQHFDNKNVGTGKTINASGLTINDGNGGNNYAISYVPNTDGEITAKGLTASVSAQDKGYDGNDNATVSASVASGLVAGDDVTVSAANGRFADKNVGQNKEVTATISKSGADAGNYAVNATANTTADITAKALTASISAQNKEYDGNDNASATGSVPAGDVVDGDQVTVTVTDAKFNDKHVGNGKPVTAGVSISNGNYRLTAGTAATTASITPKDLVIAISAQNKVYDGNGTAAVTPSIASGLVAGDAVTVAATDGAFNNKNVGTDKPVTANVRISSGDDAGNYTANATASAKADITRRTLVVSAAGEDKAYDGNATATVTLSDNRVAGDVLTLAYASAAFNNKNVGTNKPVSVSGISVTGTDAGNYTANVTAMTAAAITKRNLVVTAAGVNKGYDGTTTATVNLSDNRLAGDQLTLAYGAASFDNRNAGTGKTVTVTGITLSGTDADNYAANATASTTANITPKAITGAFTAAGKVYDGTPAATVGTRTLSGVISPDVVTLTGGTAAFADKHVGTGKTVTLTGAALTGTHAGNYSLASVNTTTADITRRTLTVTATGVNKTYDGTTAATVTLSDNRVAGDALTVSYASASFNAINVGTGKPVSVTGINVTGADAGNYSFNATAQTTANITAAPVVLTVTVAPASQQYSDRVTFTARIAGGAPLGTSTTGAAQTVTFSVGSQVMGTATLAADPARPGDLVATLANVALLEPATPNGQMAPGSKTVKAVFGSPNADYGLSVANNVANGDLTITQEDALAEYTGAASVATASTTSGDAVITLSATLRDITAATDNALTDPNGGDIRNARIRFVRIDNGMVTPIINNSATNGAITDGLGWTKVGLVNAADLKTGTVLVKTAVNIGSADANQYTYRIEVSGYYQQPQANQENIVVNVYKPLNDFITGGGHIIPMTSAGTYASDPGRKTNFGFNVRYNKTGKNLQGNINTIFRRKESDGIVHVYQIKGNSMTSLSVNASVATAKTALFNGKANMTDITNPLMPVSLGGNLTLQVTMTDKGEPGVNDQIGITVYNNAGGIFYSSNWSGTRTAETVLRGGNLVVNSGSMTFGTTAATGRQGAEAAAATAEAPAAFTVNAYPNPFANKFYLNIGSEVTGDVALTVVDGKGRTVTRQVAKAAAQAPRTVEIDLTNEDPGMYLLHVQSGARREVIKVIKMNR